MHVEECSFCRKAFYSLLILGLPGLLLISLTIVRSRWSKPLICRGRQEFRCGVTVGYCGFHIPRTFDTFSMFPKTLWMHRGSLHVERLLGSFSGGQMPTDWIVTSLAAKFGFPRQSPSGGRILWQWLLLPAKDYHQDQDSWGVGQLVRSDLKNDWISIRDTQKC